MTLKILYTGRKIQVALHESRTEDGRLLQRDVILHPGAVAILPLVDADHICLVRNNRVAVGETLLEIPAGCLEPGESPDAAAARELSEETGYHAQRWEKLTAFYPSPGCLNEVTHLFLAQDLSPGERHLAADEELQACVLPWRDVLRQVETGQVRDAKTIIALLWWARRGQ